VHGRSAISVRNAGSDCVLIALSQVAFSYSLTLSHGLVEKWRKNHWFWGPHNTILREWTGGSHQLTTCSRVLEDPAVSRAVKQTPRVFWNRKFQYSVHNSLTVFPVLATLKSPVFMIHFNVALSCTPRSAKWSVCSRFLNHRSECGLLPPDTCWTAHTYCQCPSKRRQRVTAIKGCSLGVTGGVQDAVFD
jgi:hypothetical protein